VSARERVLRALARIEEVDRPEVWITLRERPELLAEADSVDTRLAAGDYLPLAGMLFAVKDNIDVLGLPTTAGHPGFRFLPERSASAVDRLVTAGAIVLGKANLDQFATGLVGTRSPYGAVRNSRFPERISGGSSAGSAVAVALGIVDFALGTDTAGSGRVPAALNGIVGVKATIGIVPLDGVTIACRSYDCVTALAPTVALATQVIEIMSGRSATDPASRPWPSDVILSAPDRARVAVPAPQYLSGLSRERQELFASAVRTLEANGVEIAELDLAPFLACAKLLYDGALVAERYAAYGKFITENPDGADPTVARIAAAAGAHLGSALVHDQARVASYKLETLAMLADFDAMLLPTVPDHPTLEDVAADPIGINSRMGLFTNFMNLLDMAGVAVPAGETSDGFFGVTVVVRGFEDQVAIDLAAVLVGEHPRQVAPGEGIELAVLGHPELNGQLQSRGARLLETTVAAELWALSPAALGSFVAGLPLPLALGGVPLDDGRVVLGLVSSEGARR
jgi:allophanate hydrolase